MKAFISLVRLIMLLVLFAALVMLFAPVALAAQGPPAQPSPMDWLTMTLGQFLAWVVSFGIAALVAFVVQQLPFSDPVKTALAHVANLVLAAFVAAVASLIPQAYVDMRLFEVAVAVFAFIVNWAGSFLGQLQGMRTYALRLRARDQLVALRT